MEATTAFVLGVSVGACIGSWIATVLIGRECEKAIQGWDRALDGWEKERELRLQEHDAADWWKDN